MPSPKSSSFLQPTRREFLAYVGAAVAASACGDSNGGGSDVPAAPMVASNPFTLGIASGDPEAERVILWTRLAPEPIGGGMPEVDVPVVWEVALDADFARIVRDGWQYASPSLAHSLHIDADGLAPDTWYWFRFRIEGQWTSPSGRTRTLPAADATPDRFRIGVATCQNYTAGFYTSHFHLAQEEVDLVAFVGDYIYEGGGPGSGVREHIGPELRSLADFRNRYALYKSDLNLQAAHASCPWLVTWDDHEVNNNYAGLVMESGNEDVTDVLALRRNAYQAYYEHMPLRLPVPDDFGYLPIYRAFTVGDLLKIHVLDGRQYRSEQACDGRLARCSEVDDPTRTMLGSEQKTWLKNEMGTSAARWNVVAQQTVFTPVVIRGSVVNTDQWDGYAPEQHELLTLFRDVSNVVVVTGDIHLAGFGVLREDAQDPTSPIVGYEVVTTSISSNGDGGDDLTRLLEGALRGLPNIEYVNAAKRGYSICDITPDRMQVFFRIVSTVTQMTATLSTDKAFEIEADTLALRTLE